jgi:hypothetical protein
MTISYFYSERYEMKVSCNRGEQNWEVQIPSPFCLQPARYSCLEIPKVKSKFVHYKAKRVRTRFHY